MAALSIKPRTIQEQARVLSHEFPDIFDYLHQRDQELRKALGRVPSPADIELSATWNHHRFVERTLNRIGPGISELAGD